MKGKIIKIKLKRNEAEELADLGIRLGLLKQEDYEDYIKEVMKPRECMFK